AQGEARREAGGTGLGKAFEIVYIFSSSVTKRKFMPIRGRAFVCARLVIPLVLAVMVAIVFVGWCLEKFPERSSKAYDEVVSAFYVGLAALQVGDDVHADAKLAQVTQIVPGEPAGWANWGVLALRQRNLDTAAQRFERARSLAPDNDRIYD